MEKQKSKKTGLYFGSFNPIHIGHLAIANYILEFSELESIWFIVSPHNPLKDKRSLLPNNHRLQLVNLAIGDNYKMKASNIEFNLPQPSYTIHTLAVLKEKYPEREFSIIMGADNINTFHKWKNPELIASETKIIVYPRPGIDPKPKVSIPDIQYVNAPLIEISSSFIRESIKNGHDIRYFLPEKVWSYICEMHFYKK